MWSTEEEARLRKGIITRFHSNFAVVKDLHEDRTTLCTLRGRFKLMKIKPMVGDVVEYMLSGDRGRIESILPRMNTLNKPRVSNINTVVVVTCRAQPYIQYSMLDRILAGVSFSKADVILVLNKVDITDHSDVKEFRNIYSFYETVFTSAQNGDGVKELEEKLRGSVSVFAGPSGVGKSSLLNRILNANLKTGKVSNATKLGKHTTTSASLLELKNGGFVVDTPGFVTIEFGKLKPLQVQELFPEIKAASVACLFDDCFHDAEPNCNVKRLVEEGKIARSRYQNYLDILHQVGGRNEN